MLQHIPKYLGKGVSINTLSIRFSPEPEKYTLHSVFQNLRIPMYQWKRKAEIKNSLYSQISGSVETRPEAAVTNGTGNLKSFCHIIQYTITHVTGKFCRHLTASYRYMETRLYCKQQSSLFKMAILLNFQNYEFQYYNLHSTL